MEVYSEFYGHQLKQGRGFKLGEQLHTVLRQEILRGRWVVGERIPSYKEIRAQTGLSQMPIQRALDQLEADGYVERIRHKGVFVKSTATEGNRSLGTVIIPVPSDSPLDAYRRQPIVTTHGFGEISVGRLLEEADKLGLETRVCSVDELRTSDDAFADETLFGVIAMVPPNELRRALGDHHAAQTVYLGVRDPTAASCLTGDPFMAAYRVTQELVARGHRCVALLPASKYKTRTEAARAGAAGALADAGLAVAEAMPDMPLADGPVPAGATAVLAVSRHDAAACIRHARTQGLQVPRDFSVAAMQAGTRSKGTARVAGASYRWDDVLATCFDILLGSERYGGRSISRLTFEPQFNPCQSVGPAPVASN